MARFSFNNLDTELIEKLIPNKDGQDGESNTFTIVYRDGDTEIVNIRSTKDGLENIAEEKVKAAKKYKEKKKK